MSKRNRKRAAKLALVGTWVGAAVAVVASLAWGASALRVTSVINRFSDFVMLASGGVTYSWTSTEAVASDLPLPLGMTQQWEWHCVPRQVPMDWWGTFYRGTPNRSQIWVPLWPISLAGGAVAAACWRHRRRLMRAGCCEGCGYVLAGLPEGGVCPECGEGISKAGEPWVGAGSGKDERLV